MKDCKWCLVSKPLSEFYKSKTTKDGLLNKCKSCHSDWNAQNYLKNLDKNRQAISKYYYDNHEKEKENRRKYYAKNKASYLANFYKREANISRATPSWLSDEMKKEILSIYRTREVLSEQTGILHHVDHIVPIKSDIVCGLNVPWNLRVITAEENLRKSNKFKDE